MCKIRPQSSVLILNLLRIKAVVVIPEGQLVTLLLFLSGWRDTNRISCRPFTSSLFSVGKRFRFKGSEKDRIASCLLPVFLLRDWGLMLWKQDLTSQCSLAVSHFCSSHWTKKKKKKKLVRLAEISACHFRSDDASLGQRLLVGHVMKAVLWLQLLDSFCGTSQLFYTHYPGNLLTHWMDEPKLYRRLKHLLEKLTSFRNPA